MLGMGSAVRDKKETDVATISVGDVELREVRGQHGRFVGYSERGGVTIAVDMRMARKGYSLTVDFLGGGEWVRDLKGDELDKALKGWGFKGDELGKVLHEGDLRGAVLDRALKEVDMVHVVKGKEGGADLQVLKGGKLVQTLKGAMVKNRVDIHEGWEGIPKGTAGISEEFPKFWDDARMAMHEYLRTKGKNLPDRLTPFMGQGHVLG
ncbi:hypothetical protein H0N99_03670 [Candidatus Micrarchaeota archaeon]|nr:hypothetical protein [Candidatus Micrarchaeota archaeon]